MTRTAPAVRIVLTATVALLGLTGLTACGGSADETSDLAWDSQALVSIGYTTEDVDAATGTAADNDPAPAQTERQHRRFPRLRFAFRHNTLHGEAVVRTEDGTKTVVVQRGKVTAVDASSVTVQSSDGFTLTWKNGNPLSVVANRQKAELSAVTVGTEVGIAGAKDGDTPTARLIVVPKKS